MSEENVEIVRQAIEAFSSGMERGDPGGGFDLESASDDFELITLPFEGRTLWRGREGWVEFIRAFTDEFDDWSIQIERQIDAGDDRVASLMYQSGTGKRSGVPVSLHWGQIHELKDGRIIRIRIYPSHAETLEAAGLSEQAMSEENVGGPTASQRDFRMGARWIAGNSRLKSWLNKYSITDDASGQVQE